MEALVRALNALQALINWAVSQGVSRDRIQKMLDDAHENGTDITDEILRAEMDATANELDETEALINSE